LVEKKNKSSFSRALGRRCGGARRKKNWSTFDWPVRITTGPGALMHIIIFQFLAVFLSPPPPPPRPFLSIFFVSKDFLFSFSRLLVIVANKKLLFFSQVNLVGNGFSKLRNNEETHGFYFIQDFPPPSRPIPLTSPS